MALTMVPPGFELQLFVSEPDIVNPVAFTWDEAGRLFVIESVDYPHDLVVDGEGNDRITMCEDRSEEHTSELQSRGQLVCRLLLERKNNEITAALRGGKPLPPSTHALRREQPAYVAMSATHAFTLHR